MSFTIHGTGASGGIAVGFAHLVSHATLEVAHYVLPHSQVAEESSRFQSAVDATRAELEAIRKNRPAGVPAEFDALLDLHVSILNDELISRAPREMIEKEQCNAEWALKTHMDMVVAQFDEIDDPYLRERKTDVVQVVERVLKWLMGQPGYIPPPSERGQNTVLVAHDLSPADVIQFKQHPFASFMTDVGGATSHTAIIARSLAIPAVVGLHHGRQLIRENDLLIVDGAQGIVVVNPDSQILAEYKLRQEQWELERQKLKRIRATRATTLDGTVVELHANIELPEDMAQVKDSGATGIGLFRSEFLFLNRDELPDEDEQFESYRTVAEAMRGMVVTIRTLDLGADKHLNGTGRIMAPNPALGLRAVRLCLAEPQMFHTQLRAILRASFYGKVRLLIPMLSSPHELSQVLQAIERAKQSLAEEHLRFNREIEIGGMIEVPAAALAINHFLRMLDFISIGTNDLIQYTLAIDRSDDSVAHLYDPLHPAVLALVYQIIRAAKQAEVPVAVCGEIAGDPKLTRLLLGFGLRQFSMHPSSLLQVKQQVLKSRLPDAVSIAHKILKTEEADKVRALLARLNA
jgi:phosphoenolpyruvate-protein phosphotransferase (PTS system enzyme I)